jgi:hypothetical protein
MRFLVSWRIMRVSVLLVMMALTGCAASTIDRYGRVCRSAGSEDRPIAAPRVHTIMGTSAPFQFRFASYGRRCEGALEGSIQTLERNSHGLMDARGRRVLVPAKYVRVLPIDETRALVWSSSEGEPMIYEFGRGEIGSAHFQGAGRLMGPDEELSTTAAGSDTLNVYLGRGEVRQIHNLVDYRQYQDYSIVDFTTGDGAEVSVVFDAAMRQQRSPIVGRIDPWTMMRGDQPLDEQRQMDAPVDLASRSMRVSHPDLPNDYLYFPLQPDGTPAALPERAMGVMPMRIVRDHPNSTGREANYRHIAMGWVVVYPAGDGFEIAPFGGTLAETLERAPSLRRMSAWYHYDDRGPMGWHHLSTRYFGRDSAGRWRSFFPGFVDFDRILDSDRTYASVEEALFVADAARREQGRLERLAREEREREYAEYLRQEGVREWARIQSGGRLCGPDTRPGLLPPEGLERYFRECDVDPSFIRTLGGGVSAEARAIAENRTRVVAEENATARAAAERERFFGSPESQGGDPWAQGLSQAQSAAQSSTNAFIQRERETYRRNLDAWNSGAQNWR